MGKLPEVPDLLLPTGPTSRAPASGPQPSRAPVAQQGALSDGDDLFGGGIERGVTAGPSSGVPSGPHRGAKPIEMSYGAVDDDDGFGGGIEHGVGSLPSSSMSSSTAPAFSRPPASAAVPSRGPASLEVAYQRSDLQRADEDDGPSTLEKIGARAVPLVGLAAALGPLVKFVHHARAFSVMKLLPHAFDATSTVQSGVVSGLLLVFAIAVGFIGLRRSTRSYAMAASAALLLLTSLAMVTVTLVSTDESPQPPDGARLVPYLVPAAIALVGLGIAGRGVPSFLRGTLGRRALSFALGLIGGAVVFAGLALSTW